MAKKKEKNIISIIRGLWAPFTTGKGSAKTILLCLLTAFIFWFFNSLNKDYSKRLDYPITFKYNRDSLISVNKLPSHIPINVTGGGWNLLRKTMGFSIKPLTIDLESEQHQQYLTEYSLLTIATDQMDELTVNYIISDTIFINIDRKAEKKFKVKLDTTTVFLVEDFHIVSDISFDPDSVLLIGPKSILNEINGDLNLALSENNIKADFSEKVSVAHSVHPSLVSIPEQLEINFKVEEFVHRTIKFKIERVNFPEHALFLLSTATIDGTLYLPGSKVSIIDTASFVAFADYKNFNRGDSSISLTLPPLPYGIKSVELAEPSIKIIYQ